MPNDGNSCGGVAILDSVIARFLKDGRFIDQRCVQPCPPPTMCITTQAIHQRRTWGVLSDTQGLVKRSSRHLRELRK